jgi:hypothetical protein
MSRNRAGASGPDAIRKANVTLGATTINSLTTGTITFPFSGARITDVASINPKAALTTGLGIAGIRVSAAGVCTLTVMNALATASNLGTLNCDVTIQRFST